MWPVLAAIGISTAVTWAANELLFDADEDAKQKQMQDESIFLQKKNGNQTDMYMQVDGKNLIETEDGQVLIKNSDKGYQLLNEDEIVTPYGEDGPTFVKIPESKEKLFSTQNIFSTSTTNDNTNTNNDSDNNSNNNNNTVVDDAVIDDLLKDEWWQNPYSDPNGSSNNEIIDCTGN